MTTFELTITQTVTRKLFVDTPTAQAAVELAQKKIAEAWQNPCAVPCIGLIISQDTQVSNVEKATKLP